MKLAATISLVLGLPLSVQSATILSETRPDGPGSDSFAPFNAPDEVSNDFANPTPFLLALGTNVLELTFGGSGPSLMGGATNGSDADFVRFVVPDGTFVSSIRVLPGQRSPHFFAATFGDQFDFAPENNINSNFARSLNRQVVFGGLITELTGQALINPDRNFTGLFQEIDGGRANATFEVILVPEPSTVLFSLLGFWPLLHRRRHSK